MEMGRRGRQRVEQWYSLERMVRATEGVYRQAMGSAGAATKAATA